MKPRDSFYNQHLLTMSVAHLLFGITFGVIASEKGLSTWQAMLMSLFVFATTSQVIAVGLLAAGESILAVAITTFIVNIRHLLFSIAIAPLVTHWTRIQRFFLGLHLSDEMFLLHVDRLRQDKSVKPKQLYTLNFLSHLIFIFGTGLGYLGTCSLQLTGNLGLEFAIPAMCISLLVSQLNRNSLVVPLASMSIAGLLSFLGLGFSSVLIAALLGAFFSTEEYPWKTKSSSVSLS